jgi:diguanylate cyclase (GGDEF)-like protein
VLRHDAVSAATPPVSTARGRRLQATILFSRALIALVIATFLLSVTVGVVHRLIHPPQGRDSTVLFWALIVLGLGGLLWSSVSWLAERARPLLVVGLALVCLWGSTVANLPYDDGGPAVLLFYALPVLYGAQVGSPVESWLITANAVVACGWLSLATSDLATGLHTILYGSALMVVLTGLFLGLRTRTDTLLGRLEKLALQDSLTGLANRTAFAEQSPQALRAGLSTPGCVLLILDIDQFKRVNDQGGHPLGDAALVHVATLLRRAFDDTLGCWRIGGDEFALLVGAVADADAAGCADDLALLIAAHPLTDHRGRVDIAVSVGHAHAPSEGEDLPTLFARADERLLAGKRAGSSP